MPKPMRLFYLQNIRNCLRIQRFIHILLHFLECYFFSLLWILLVRFVCIYLTPESMISGETEMFFYYTYFLVSKGYIFIAQCKWLGSICFNCV